MKTILFLWFAMGMACFAKSQIVTIVDVISGDPLENVSIIGQNPQAYTTTNVNGVADITAFEKSTVILIKLVGYQPVYTDYTALSSLRKPLQLQREQVSMAEVVVSGTKWKQTQGDLPSKITTITPKQAALQNPQTAADLLGISGSVFIQKSQQGGGSPMIRGFATNRLLYAIDGIRMNTAIFRGGNIQNVISLDPFSIENTEVFFGPGSVIYGSDAIGGVMSFTTIDPELAYSDTVLVNGKAITRYASANNEKTMHFDINIGWKKWSFLTSISSNDFGDLKMGSKGPDEYLRPHYVQRQDSVDVVVTNDDPRIQRPSGYTQQNLMQKVRFRPNVYLDMQYALHYSETSDYSRYDRHVRYKNGLPRYGEWSYGPQKWLMNNFQLTHNKSNPVYDEMTLRLAHQMFEESRLTRDINKPDREIRAEEVTALSGNLDFVRSVGAKNKLTYGIELVTNEVNSTGKNVNIETGVSEPGPTRYPQSTWSSYGVYVNNQYTPNDKITVVAGLRYNQYILHAYFDTSFYPFPFTTANINNGGLTGSLGMTWRPGENWLFRLNGSTGFRSPNVDDVGKVFDSEPGFVVIPNPNLEAEYAYNVDLGIARKFGKAVKLDVTGFYTILEKALVRRNFTLNGEDSMVYDGTPSQIQAIQNAAVATVYGAQANLEIKLRSGFGLSSTINYQIGEEELDDGTVSPSRHAAPIFGVTRLFYATDKLEVQFYAAYSGAKNYEDLPEEEKGKDYIYAMDSDGNPYSPSWYTLNFKAMYRFSNHFSVSAGMENLLDERYRPYSSGIVAPGRNVLLSLQAHF